MEIGLEHLFYAFSVTWMLHLGYLLNLSFRQKHLAGELETLKKALAEKDSG